MLFLKRYTKTIQRPTGMLKGKKRSSCPGSGFSFTNSEPGAANPNPITSPFIFFRVRIRARVQINPQAGSKVRVRMIQDTGTGFEPLTLGLSPNPELLNR